MYDWKIIDLHAHPQLKPLNASEADRQEKGLWKYFDESPSCGDLKGLRKLAARSGKKDSQTNLNKAIKGKVKGIFFAMGPVERNFFDLKLDHVILSAMFSSLTKRIDFAACLTGFDPENVKRVMDRVKNEKGVDYYNEELVPEYNFLIEESGKTTENGYEMIIAEDATHFKSIIEAENKVGVVLTIEGAHALGNYADVKDFKGDVNYANSSEVYQRLSPVFAENIQKIKLWGNGKHAPFFITLCHHFTNLLAGHARSFSDGGVIKPGQTDLFNQDSGLNGGISKLGWEVIEQLLSKQNGRRILIDVKHMSVQSRIEYFSYLRDRHWANGDLVPIVCSHGAVNGFKSLANSRRSIDRRKKNRGHYYSRYSINLSDEEIKFIYESKGIIGIMLHKGRMPGPRAHRRFRSAGDNPDLIRDRYFEMFMSNVMHIVKVIGKPDAWDIISVGTDYDGIIEAFDTYEDYEKLPELMQHMLQYLSVFPRSIVLEGIPKSEARQLLYGLSPEVIVNKVCGGNIVKFLERNF